MCVVPWHHGTEAPNAKDTRTQKQKNICIKKSSLVRFTSFDI